MLRYFTLAGRGHYYGLAYSTNQATSLTKLSLREMPAPASKMVECVSPMKSEETTCEGESDAHFSKPSHVTRQRYAVSDALSETDINRTSTYCHLQVKLMAFIMPAV